MKRWANMQETLASESVRVKLIEHKLLGHTCSNCDFFRNLQRHNRQVSDECDHPIHTRNVKVKPDHTCIRWENRHYDDH